MFREREGLTPCRSSVRVSCTPIVFSADLHVVFAMLLILARPSAPLRQTGGGCCRCALLACHTGPHTWIAARVAGSVWCVLCMVFVRIVGQICCRKVVCCRSWRVIAASGRSASWLEPARPRPRGTSRVMSRPPEVAQYLNRRRKAQRERAAQREEQEERQNSEVRWQPIFGAGRRKHVSLCSRGLAGVHVCGVSEGMSDVGALNPS